MLIGDLVVVTVQVHKKINVDGTSYLTSEMKNILQIYRVAQA